MTRLIVLGAAAILLATVGIYLFAGYGRDMRAHRERVSAGFYSWEGPFGRIDYARGGPHAGVDGTNRDAAPVLIVHGAGGGWDQGAAIANLVCPKDRRWIAPSRFGFLGSSAPSAVRRVISGNAGQEGRRVQELQAEALDALMRTLGHERYHVVAMSAGGSTGLVLAGEFPSVLSVTFLSAGLKPLEDTHAAEASARKGDILERLVSRDWPYWFVSTRLRGLTVELCGVSREEYRRFDSATRLLGERFLDIMNPASLRALGNTIDNRTSPSGSDLARVAVPALIVHAENDGLQLFENARSAVEEIPDSRILSFASGGHVAIAVHRCRIRDELAIFLSEVPDGPRPGRVEARGDTSVRVAGFDGR